MSLPNFLVIGAQKSGTTALYHYLKQHPQIYMSPVKEPHFFTYEGWKPNFAAPGCGYASAVTNIDDYRALFKGVPDGMVLGEASTSYIYFARALERIRCYAPEVSLIAVLRDPAERAYSNYLHCVRGGREPLDSFEQALRAEVVRMRDNWGPVYHYKRKGFYYVQLKRYFDAFGRDRVRVYLYEDLKEDPLGLLQDAFGYLGVDDSFVPDVSLKHNVSGVPKNKALLGLARRLGTLTFAVRPCIPSRIRRHIKAQVLTQPPRLSPEVREGLVKEYREDIQRLEELIQRDLSRWLA